MKLRAVLLVFASALFFQGCGSGSTPPKSADAAAIRTSVRDDAFRIMNALSFYAAEFGDGKVPAWSTADPPAWWKTDPSSKKLTPGVEYKLAQGVAGMSIAGIDPSKPMFLATGKPIAEGFGKSEIVITAGLLPDPESHSSVAPTEPKTDKW